MEIVQIALMCLWIVFIIILFVGMCLKNLKLIYPHFFVAGVLILALTIFFIMFCVDGHTPEIVVFAICIPILAYCLFMEWMYLRYLTYNLAVGDVESERVLVVQ